MKNINLMLTCTGGILSYQLIQLIKQSKVYKYTITGVDSTDNPVAKNILDFFEKVPLGTDNNYSNIILDICKKNNIEIVFPGSDEEAMSLSKNKEKFFNEGITVACNDIEIMNIINNKINTYKALEKIGIKVPDYKEANDSLDLKKYVNHYMDKNGSCVVKLPEARGGRGIVFVEKNIVGSNKIKDSRQEITSPDIFFDKYLKKYSFENSLMIMEKLEDPIYDLDILAWKNEPINIVSRKRIDALNPNAGHILEENKLIIEIGKKIIEKFNIQWIFDIDFMFSSDGVPSVLEINPRASGSLCISIKAGLPIFDNMISLLHNEKIIKKNVPYGCVIRPYSALSKI
jgi:carbamoyl-phosphate synthase large subunit